MNAKLYRNSEHIQQEQQSEDIPHTVQVNNPVAEIKNVKFKNIFNDTFYKVVQATQYPVINTNKSEFE